jgi:hypothetical protein
MLINPGQKFLQPLCYAGDLIAWPLFKIDDIQAHEHC